MPFKVEAAGGEGGGMRYVLTALLISALSGCAFVKVNVGSELKGVEERVVSGKGRAKIVVIDISGIISMDHLGLERFGKEPPMIPRLQEQLNAARADDDVAGLVVRIDSPGGSVTASDILYHEVKTFGKEKGVPVVACIMDKGLSGGYYAALGADEIMAHPTSIVGGVGVISFRFDISEMLDTWGVRIGTIQSGPKKDFWSPLRSGTPEENAVMQGIVDRLNQRFLQIITENRSLSPASLEKVAEGGVFDAAAALDLGLIDGIGYLEDAISRIRKLAGVSEARVILYRRPGALAESIYAGSAPLLRALSNVELGVAEMLTPSFRYQYLP
jgi:protease-4